MDLWHEASSGVWRGELRRDDQRNGRRREMAEPENRCIQGQRGCRGKEEGEDEARQRLMGTRGNIRIARTAAHLPVVDQDQ